MTSSPTPTPSFLSELDDFLRARLNAAPEGSYSSRLMADPVFAQRKIMEEAFEVCLELGAARPDPSATAEEAADLVFHLVAGLVGAGVAWADVEAVLRERHGRPARDSTYGTEETP
jgi:phosphoribosyl-ATP pyrophosphohydrolase